MKWLSVLVFVLVLAAEFLLFDRMTSQYHAKVYPRWNDQIQPLIESYTGYEYRQTHGLLAGLGHTLAQPAAMGDLHSFWALLVFEAAGRPSRSATLAVNMLAFLAWQAALAFAVARGGGSRALAWLSVGLTLALCWPWSGIQGSATDFRLDHVTMCMMGISLAAVLLADGFRSAGWSGVFGVAVGLTLLTRFLTGTYFAVIFGACLVWILVSRERWRRGLNLGLAAAVAAVLAAPCFWFNRREIYEHYWLGHYASPEVALWDTRLSFGQSFLRLWRQLGTEQLGVAFGLAAGLAVLVLAGGVWFARRGPAPERAGGRNPWPGDAAMLGAIFLLAPALVLALQNGDFLVVLGAAVPGAIGLILALCAGLHARSDRRFSAAAALLAVVVGGGYFAIRQTSAPYDAAFAADNRQINAVADRIFATVQTYGITRPRIAVDQVTDCLDGNVLSVICYERHQTWVPFIMELPTGISAAAEAVLMQHLADSDFVFVTEDGPPGQWAYDRQMFELRPKILAWCEDRLQLVDRFTVFGRRLALYQRPEIGAAPIFVVPSRLLASTKGDYANALQVVRGPAQYAAADLPPGLTLDGRTGWIRGRPTQTGTFVTKITATNPAGSTTRKFTFQVEDADFLAAVSAPATGATGQPVAMSFEAFAAAGTLDFIEVADLTTKKTLDRVPAGLDERQNWRGAYSTTFAEPGVHSMLLRFVRLEAGQYIFLDRFFEISIVPAAPAARQP